MSDPHSAKVQAQFGAPADAYVACAGFARGDHAPWPLRLAEADIERNTMARPHKIPLPGAAQFLHFSRRLDVRIWPLPLVEAP